jgi:hypothetical protein
MTAFIKISYILLPAIPARNRFPLEGSVEAVAMDMWKPLRDSVINNALQARIVFDKFHIMHHLSKALDEVRRSEYKRLTARTGVTSRAAIYLALATREPESGWKTSTPDIAFELFAEIRTPASGRIGSRTEVSDGISNTG